MDKYKSEEIKSIICNFDKQHEKASLENAIKRAKNKAILTLCDKDFFSESKKAIIQLKEKNLKGAIVLVGIWRGGSAIYIKQLIDDLELTNPLFLIDTFEGFNEPPSSIYTKDYMSYKYFSNNFPAEENPSMQDVENNFKKLAVSLENVHFIKASNQQSLNEIRDISFMHIDVDMYQPTYFYLTKFYRKILPQGFLIIDDYGVELFNCKDAVDKFIEDLGIKRNNLNHFQNICTIQKE